MIFTRRLSILHKSFQRYYTSCSRTCKEDDNFFSTTMKVTFFNILFTGYLSNCLIQMNYNQQHFEKNLNEKLDEEFSKLNNPITKLDTELQPKK
jgi:hypothetical protein